MSEDQPEDKVVFHYSREHRLSRASESVKRAYEEGYAPKRGFLHGLTANAGLRSIFMTIIILSATIVFLSIFVEPENTTTINGTNIRLKAFLYDKMIYVSLVCSTKAVSERELAFVSVLFEGFDVNGNMIQTKSASGILGGEELTLRTTMPDSDISKIVAEVDMDQNTKTLSVTVDRK